MLHLSGTGAAQRSVVSFVHTTEFDHEIVRPPSESTPVSGDPANAIVSRLPTIFPLAGLQAGGTEPSAPVAVREQWSCSTRYTKPAPTQNPDADSQSAGADRRLLFGAAITAVAKASPSPSTEGTPPAAPSVFQPRPILCINNVFVTAAVLAEGDLGTAAAAAAAAALAWPYAGPPAVAGATLQLPISTATKTCSRIAGRSRRHVPGDSLLPPPVVLGTVCKTMCCGGKNSAYVKSWKLPKN